MGEVGLAQGCASLAVGREALGLGEGLEPNEHGRLILGPRGWSFASWTVRLWRPSQPGCQVGSVHRIRCLSPPFSNPPKLHTAVSG